MRRRCGKPQDAGGVPPGLSEGTWPREALIFDSGLQTWEGSTSLQPRPPPWHCVPAAAKDQEGSPGLYNPQEGAAGVLSWSSSIGRLLALSLGPRDVRPHLGMDPSGLRDAQRTAPGHAAWPGHEAAGRERGGSPGPRETAVLGE